MVANRPSQQTQRDVFVLDACRTPIGRHGGALAGVRPDDLAAVVMRAAVERLPELDPARIDDVWFGNANGAGEENRNVARMGLLLAGLPTSIPGATVNRLCGSGLEAVACGSREIAAGDADVVIAGGVESMSRSPWVVMKPARPNVHQDVTMYSTTVGWRLVNPAMPAEWTVSLGEAAELAADRFGITREAQDAWSAASHHKAAAAWDAGVFADEVVPVPGVDLSIDEGIRPNASVDTMAKLRPSFRPNGTVTPGNASQLSDGAAALMLGTAAAADAAGCRPLARIASRAVHAVDPQWWTMAPVEAAEKALKAAGIGWGDLAAVELNEAFASQVLTCLSHWHDLDQSIVNHSGGAIAMGHPLGCSGARVLGTLAWRLANNGGGWGLATLCIGVGQGIAVVIEAEGR
jgi:acetyl-CoA acetyltransferase family protein